MRCLHKDYFNPLAELKPVFLFGFKNAIGVGILFIQA